MDDLQSAVRGRGPAAYVVTVNEAGTPHVVNAEVLVAESGLVAIVGEGTARNALERPRVSLLYPCRSGADYSLIVDAVATVVADAGGRRLLLTATRAVLERPGPPPGPTTPPCSSDCVELALRPPR
jgi:hypothetical protein